MIFYLLNKGQQTVKILNNNETVESNLDETINEASELKFSVPLQKRLDSNIYYVLIPTDSGNDFYMFKIISEDIQKDSVEYSAVESAYDELKSYSYIKDIRPNQMNAAQMLRQVLKNTRWSLGYVENTGIQSATFYYITVLEAIQKIVDLFKVELTFTIQLDPVTQQITGRKVNLYQQQGRRTGKRFEYGSNLLTVTREENSQNLVTALVGRGKGIQVSGQNTEDTTDDGYGRRLTFADVEWKTTAGAPVNKPKGQEYVEDPKATALYGFSDGRPRIGLVTFEDIEDPNELLNATWSALLEAKRPKVSFKAEVTDVGDLQLGDTIAIIRHDLGIEYFTRVYKVHHDLKDKNKNTVEMGDDFSSRSITSAISTAIQTSQDATEIANTAAIAANGKNRNFYSNTKPNWANEGDNLYLDLGNGETELWVWHHGQWEFVQSTVELHTAQKEVQEAQSGLNDAKKQIADNLAKADGDIAELNASIKEQKKEFDTDIDELNASIRDQKGTIDGLSTTINTVAIPKITEVTNKVSDALTKINDQKNIVTGLQTQSAQQGKDISKITTDIHGVSVDLANLNGDVNQTKVTVQGLQSTLGNAQGDIAQIKVDAKKLETSLSGKVDNSTYANFVNQTNQALNAKLVASDLRGYAKTTDVQATANGLQLNINNVTDKLNNLRIGGRNLVGKTDKEYVMGFGIPNTVWKDNFAYTSLPVISSVGGEILPQGAGFWHVLSPGEEYTQTIWIETDAIIKSLNGTFLTWLTMDDGHDVQKAHIQKIGNNSYKIIGSYTWPQNKKGNRVRLFDIFNLQDSIDLKSGTYLKFGKLKLEVGNASTDWTPAVEDTEHDLENLSARITINSQQFGSYYTKGESDNRTNIAKNEVINSIKNDSNWHGLTNILTNSGFIQTADGFIQKVQQTMQPIINENNSGGVNLLTNTYTLHNFNNAGNAGEATGFGIESGNSHKNELNAGEISTNVFHIYAKDLNHAPVYFGQNFTLPKGTWTLSFLVRHNGSSEQKIRLSFYTDDCANRGWIPLGTSDEIDNIWKRHQITFTTTQETFEQNPRLHMPTGDIVPGGSLYFANFKLESGSIATTWCPSSEDLAKQVEVTELNQTIKGLQSTVSSNYGNLQSQISQTAGTIRSEVTNKTNNLQSQITQNANNINIKVNAVGDLSNICLNPSFIDGSTQGWENVFSSSGDPGSPTKFYGGVSTRNAFYGNMFPVATGDKYFFSVFAWQNQSTHPLNVGLTYLQKDGSWNWQSAVNFAPNEGARTKSGSITIPNEAVKARIWVEIDAYSDYGHWWFTNLTVRKNDTISQINMSAGTTLIQNDKIYMDASSTVFSGKAFIPDAAITNISADKINAGTLDAGRINVINLNANNITTGTINGANLKINLNNGEILFQKGRISSTNGNLNIDIDSGTMSVTNWMNEGVYFKDGKLILDDRGFGGLIADDPKYGVIQRSNQMFNNNAFGMELNSPNGVSLRTSNYDGVINTGSGLDGTKNGAVISVDKDGSAVVNGAGTTFLTGGPKFAQSKYSIGTRPHVWVGIFNGRLGDRIEIDANYVHLPTTYYRTTGSAPNLCIASDGALVRSTSASKYKTDIKRSFSTDYGEKLLNLPTAIWTDKGQKERYEAGKRRIKPEKYFGMIAEDLADAGLDLLVSRNPQTHEIEGIQYERIAPALLPVIKELKDKVNKLEKKVNE